MWSIVETLGKLLKGTFTFGGGHRRCSMKKGVLRNFTKFKEKTCAREYSFKKLQASRTPFLQNTSGRMLLYLGQSAFWSSKAMRKVCHSRKFLHQIIRWYEVRSAAFYALDMFIVMSFFTNWLQGVHRSTCSKCCSSFTQFSTYF